MIVSVQCAHMENTIIVRGADTDVRIAHPFWYDRFVPVNFEQNLKNVQDVQSDGVYGCQSGQLYSIKSRNFI